MTAVVEGGKVTGVRNAKASMAELCILIHLYSGT